MNVVLIYICQKVLIYICQKALYNILSKCADSTFTKFKWGRIDTCKPLLRQQIPYYNSITKVVIAELIQEIN